MKISIKDFFSKCHQILRKLRIWSHLLKKSLIENFIFCAVLETKDIILSWVCVMSLLSSVKVAEMHVGFLSFIPKTITEYSINVEFCEDCKTLYQYSVTREFSEFLLIFTSKEKMNFRSSFRFLVDFMQPSVLNVNLTKINLMDFQMPKKVFR